MSETKNFSRRHKTAEAHIAAQRVREERVARWEEIMRVNAEERAKRTPQQQIAVLDKRLGKGKGAKKERARLLAQIENKPRDFTKGKRGRIKKKASGG